MTINPEFEIGQIVYFVSDDSQLSHIVTGIEVRSDCVRYLVANGSNPEISVQGIELNTTKDFTKC